ncbi:hypothetical protein MsAg5_08230 [Methanosarcinaceae archaeon Ag5]|uniref:Uncharacterized protein n=1 Tax=Methanolapillus africanus TaxID=3028297 RepID=A0AAE4MI06_9EURY|nr:hypothetical protein [Methanosarcinaceae archaeon Ag5]
MNFLDKLGQNESKKTKVIREANRKTLGWRATILELILALVLAAIVAGILLYLNVEIEPTSLISILLTFLQVTAALLAIIIASLTIIVSLFPEHDEKKYRQKEKYFIETVMAHYRNALGCLVTIIILIFSIIVTSSIHQVRDITDIILSVAVFLFLYSLLLALRSIKATIVYGFIQEDPVLTDEIKEKIAPITENSDIIDLKEEKKPEKTEESGVKTEEKAGEKKETVKKTEKKEDKTLLETDMEKTIEKKKAEKAEKSDADGSEKTTRPAEKSVKKEDKKENNINN